VRFGGCGASPDGEGAGAGRATYSGTVGILRGSMLGARALSNSFFTAGFSLDGAGFSCAFQYGLRPRSAGTAFVMLPPRLAHFHFLAGLTVDQGSRASRRNSLALLRQRRGALIPQRRHFMVEDRFELPLHGPAARSLSAAANADARACEEKALLNVADNTPRLPSCPLIFCCVVAIMALAITPDSAALPAARTRAALVRSCLKYRRPDRLALGLVKRGGLLHPRAIRPHKSDRARPCPRVAEVFPVLTMPRASARRAAPSASRRPISPTPARLRVLLTLLGRMIAAPARLMLRELLAFCRRISSPDSALTIWPRSLLVGGRPNHVERQHRRLAGSKASLPVVGSTRFTITCTCGCAVITGAQIITACR
jgi:hypothetical protein